MATAAEDRSWLEYVRTLRRVKVTLNEDEVLALYHLIVAERSDNMPSILPGLPSDLKYAMGTALAKLSDAHLGLAASKGGI